MRFLFVLLMAAIASAQTISTIAGGGTGNVYVSDSSANRVMRISVGNVSLVSGTGAAGFAGDGGAANVAQLNAPLGLATDSAGNLYIADSSNGRVRKVTPSGTIRTYAG